MASSSGGASYDSSFLRQISPARAAVSLAPSLSQRSKFAVEESHGRWKHSRKRIMERTQGSAR